MSAWTHVAAVFRVDSLRLPGTRDPSADDWDKVTGREIFEPSSFPTVDDYERRMEEDDWNDYRRNPSAFMPTGSEGSLHRLVWVNPNRSSIPAYTVTVFGDLRDYDDWEAIRTWFRDVCSRCSIRQAVCTCNLGGGRSMTWTDTD